MGSNVAKKDETMPTFADEMFDDDVLGYSENPDDSLIPILAILQDNSGEVKKRHERYIDGSEAGMLIVRSMQKVFDGDEGIVFQPCGFTHTWVEWEGDPGEGHPVAQYDFNERPSDATEVEKPDGGTEWRRDNGNRLIETRNHFGNIITDSGAMPMVIAMSGSNHTASRQWTTLMKQHRTPQGRRAAAFMRTYKITTVFSQKGQQSWYKYKIQDLGWVDEQYLQDGFNFAKSIKVGDVKADIDSDAPKDDVPF